MNTNTQSRTYVIMHAENTEHVQAVRQLCVEYISELNLSLDFQGFQEEMQQMPGKYAPPSGYLLLGLVAGEPAGCVGLRKLEPGVCEMKRLYVRPAFRQSGLGKELVRVILAKGRELHYKHIRLDTLTSMAAANKLYVEFGFRDIPAYCHNPLKGARYMEMSLAAGLLQSSQTSSGGMW